MKPSEYIEEDAYGTEDTMALERISADAPLEKLLEAYHRDGGLIVENIFAKDTIRELRNDLMRVAEEFAPGAATQGRRTDGQGVRRREHGSLLEPGKALGGVLRAARQPRSMLPSRTRCC